MSTKRIMLVGGARPNFMKIAPIAAALRQYRELEIIFVHTGQHYDDSMSDVFLQELELPSPDYSLEIGSGSHAQQTARIMAAFEPVVLSTRPHLVILVGDVNSTLACALVCAKLDYDRDFSPIIPLGYRRPLVAHVEAGLRSFDWTMPEEVNRVLADRLSDILFITSPEAIGNLDREGIPADRIYHVGNVMIDTLLTYAERAEQSPIRKQLGLEGLAYGVVTLHRPSNVDDHHSLTQVVEILSEVQARLPLVFPIHPRTMVQFREARLLESLERLPWLKLVQPLGYLDFLHLLRHARVVLTDSGGIQEETTILGIPCLTLRENTERPITLTNGTNRLVGLDRLKILEGVAWALDGFSPPPAPPPLWDGRAASRIASVLNSLVLGDCGPVDLGAVL